MTTRLHLQPLTRESFTPFGDVIAANGADSFLINNGSTERFHDLARVETTGDEARTLISIFRGQPFSAPFTIAMMERHPLGSQAFFPLHSRPWLVVVALHDATGRQVMQISRPVNNERLDLSNFVNGLYTITFIKDERVWSTRIVKQ